MTRVLRFWVYLVGEKVWVLVLYLIKIIGLQGPGLIGAIGETTKVPNGDKSSVLVCGTGYSV